MIKNIRWNVSGGFRHYDQILQFNDTIKKFYATEKNFIKSVFDNSYGFAWNGGRILTPQHFWTINEMQKYIASYNELGIGFNLNFSQPDLSEADLENKYCNIITKFLNSNSLNGIIYSSDLLGKYLKENYSNLKLIYSACVNIKDIDTYNKKTQENNIVVLSPDFNRDFDFLNKLKDKDKIEIIANEPCFINCPYRIAHYQRIAEYNKNSTEKIILDAPDLSNFDLCLARYNGYVNPDCSNTNRLNLDEILKLKDLGFTNFKLIGREWSPEMMLDELRTYIEQGWVKDLMRINNEY